MTRLPGRSGSSLHLFESTTAAATTATTNLDQQPEPLTTDDALKSQALDHLRELLEVHWREARESADENGKFAIGFKVAVTDGVPVKLKVTSRISTTITDEIESTVDDPNQPSLL